MQLVKAHAYGNDFLLVDDEEARVHAQDLPGLARAVCERHTGIGADGLILYRLTGTGASMRLLNADGSRSEVSGNGVRCLAALLVRRRGGDPSSAGGSLRIETEAGFKDLSLERTDERRCTFRAAMGQPERLRQVALDLDGEAASAVALSVGNPQCVLLGGPLDMSRLARVGRALQAHRLFPEGVNVELAEIVSPDRVRILIWERGVGPTRSSGTGSCAAAVAAAAFGGAARQVDVEAPGGTQRVEWRDDGLFLTGWAEIVLEGHWVA